MGYIDRLMEGVRDFSLLQNVPTATMQPPTKWGRQRGRGREVHHSPTSSVEFKNQWSSTSPLPYFFMVIISTVLLFINTFCYTEHVGTGGDLTNCTRLCPIRGNSPPPGTHLTGSWRGSRACQFALQNVSYSSWKSSHDSSDVLPAT